MKNKIVIKVGFGILFSASLTAGILLGVSKNIQKEVQGYSTSSLPTTIDLNDTSAANIRSYYSSLNSLGENERKGTNLLKNLKNILKNGQKYYAYDDGSEIWQIYEITDRDWELSPASSTTYGTYDSSTNKITNYTYGTSGNNSRNNPYIHALYINRNVTNETKAWGNHNQNEWGINREHVWPKSEGFDEAGVGGARGDPMHLISGNGYTNNIHSNYFYGYVDTSRTYTDCGNTYSNQSGNLKGYSKTSGGSTYVFEPQDCDKGDIARAVFYMAARYNFFSGSDSDGIDTNNPNLELTQNLSDFSSAFTSSTTRSGKLGILSDLLAWHHADPVDQYEIHRNNLLYTNYTNNRNPFIDFPEWADFIWGTAKYNGSTYQSYSSTPTGYATPSTDTINGYNSGGTPTPDTKTTSGSVSASEGALEGWTCVDVGSAYADGSIKLDSTGDNVYCLSLFSGNISYNMTEISVTINAKYNVGTNNTPSPYNSYKVEALDSSGNVLGEAVKTGADIFSTSSYSEATFTISGGLTNCAGLRFTYNNKGLGNIALSGISWIATYVDASEPEITSISASVNKTYKVGDLVVKSDIIVVDNNGTAVSDYQFANNNYQITYEDAPSGGSSATKTFTNAITYNGLSCSLTVSAHREAHVVSTSTVSYTGAQFSSAGISSSYTENQLVTVNGMSFNVSGYIYSSKLSLSSGKTSAPGSVTNTAPYSAGITNVVSNGASPDIQLSESGSSWVDLANANTDNVDYHYFKIFYKTTTQTNYVNITSIDVTTKNEIPVNLANYIMYEDTTNQCTSKFGVAKSYFEALTPEGRSEFMNSNDYVINHAKTRLQAWALNLGKEIAYVDGDYVVSDSRRTTHLAEDKNSSVLILVLITGFSAMSALTCIIIKRKRQVK